MTTPSNFSIRRSPPRPQRYCTSPCSTMAWMHLLPSRAASRAGRRPFGLFQEALSLSGVWWRRGRDSNPDTVTRMPHFECGAFNHSATSPSLINLEILRLDASAEGHLLPLCYHFFLEAPVYS